MSPFSASGKKEGCESKNYCFLYNNHSCRTHNLTIFATKTNSKNKLI